MGGSATTHSIPGSQYIDGAWSTGGGATCEVIDPATETLLADLPSSSDTDVDGALLAARKAQTAWARAAQAAGEVDFAELILRYTAEWDRRIEGEILAGDTPGEVIHLLRAPIGVVSAICPWNYPLAVCAPRPSGCWLHHDVLDDFSERYVSAVRDLTLGDPAGNVDIGPLVSAAQLAKTEAAVALAVEEGAQVLTGGGRPDGSAFERGYWFSPTVFHDVRPGMRVMTEETFGPVVLRYTQIKTAYHHYG